MSLHHYQSRDDEDKEGKGGKEETKKYCPLSLLWRLYPTAAPRREYNTALENDYPEALLTWNEDLQKVRYARLMFSRLPFLSLQQRPWDCKERMITHSITTTSATTTPSLAPEGGGLAGLAEHVSSIHVASG